MDTGEDSLMKFGQPEYLHLLWLALGLYFFFQWAWRRKQKLAGQFADWTLLRELAPQRALTYHRSRGLWWLASWVLLVGALAQPRWGFHWDQLHQRGADVIIAIDVSTSMLATDIKPNRLERAKFKVTDLIHMLEGDRIGLVAFAGNSFVQCPLTLDYKAAEIFLSALGVDLIPVQGTALGHAIRTSIDAFSKKEKKSKALILITDGEDHTGMALTAAREARDEGVKIFVIGIGNEEGVPVPAPNGGFKKDDKGNVVMSRLNVPLLQKIAEETGGSFVKSVTGDLDLEKIYRQDIQQRVESKDLTSNRRKRWQEQFQWFIALGLLFLVVERGIRER